MQCSRCAAASTSTIERKESPKKINQKLEFEINFDLKTREIEVVMHCIVGMLQKFNDFFPLYNFFDDFFQQKCYDKQKQD